MKFSRASITRASTWMAKWRKDRRGQVSVMFAVSAIGLLSFAGAGIDVGTLQKQGVKLQDSVDAAALYAAREVALKSLTDAEAAQAVERYLEAGYDKDVSPEWSAQPENLTETRVVSRNPVEVEVTATRAIEMPFGQLTGGGKRVMSRTAGATEAQETAVTLLLLHRTAASAWRATGTSGLVALDGVAVVNSSSPAALSGAGTADIETAGTLVVGPPSAAEQWTPRPKFHASPVNDPYKNQISWPSAAGSGAGCKATNLQVKNTTMNLQPGNYCGGLSVTTHGVANLAPGLYVIEGPLTVTSNAKLYAPEGVTFVLVGSTAKVTFQAGSNVTIVSPDEGDWKHIAIAQKPQSTELVSTLIGGAELTLDGVLYFPTQKVLVTGGAAADVITGTRVLIANRLETSGNGEIYLKGNKNLLSTHLGSRLTN
jgi:Flp pilus assembly protein TadG